MKLRKSTDKDRRGLKLATQRMLDMCGGQDSSASVTRINQRTLSDYANTGNERHADSFMPVDVLADLVLDCKARGEVAPLLSALCELGGGRFERVAARTNTCDAIALVDSVLKQTMELRDRLIDQEAAE
ncbi:hypothetical protein [Roseibium sp.]|uniref:hypothetical protein n=1 Tax=Roseibium sp. TaxID=1936156 RepID=UPI003298D23B